MARYSRESRKRAIREGTIGSFHCATCGQSFWDEMQKRDHYGWSAGRPYCQYGPAGPSPTTAKAPCWHGDSRSCMCEEGDPDADHLSNDGVYAELAALERAAAGADPYAREVGE